MADRDLLLSTLSKVTSHGQGLDVLSAAAAAEGPEVAALMQQHLSERQQQEVLLAPVSACGLGCAATAAGAGEEGMSGGPAVEAQVLEALTLQPSA